MFLTGHRPSGTFSLFALRPSNEPHGPQRCSVLMMMRSGHASAVPLPTWQPFLVHCGSWWRICGLSEDNRLTTIRLAREAPPSFTRDFRLSFTRSQQSGDNVRDAAVIQACLQVRDDKGSFCVYSGQRRDEDVLISTKGRW